MGNRIAKHSSNSYDPRYCFNISDEFKCNVSTVNKWYNQIRIKETFCHNISFNDSPPNCECTTCLRCVWITNEFKYEGRVTYGMTYYSFGSKKKLGYHWYATGEGKCAWGRKNKSMSFEGYFKYGKPLFGTIKYNDGTTYNGRFLNGFERGPDSVITWKDGTVFKGNIYIDKGTGLLIPSKLIIDLSSNPRYFSYSSTSNPKYSITSGAKYSITSGAKYSIASNPRYHAASDSNNFYSSGKILKELCVVSKYAIQLYSSDLFKVIVSTDVRRIIFNYLEITVIFKFAGRNERGNPPVITHIHL